MLNQNSYKNVAFLQNLLKFLRFSLKNMLKDVIGNEISNLLVFGAIESTYRW